MTGDTSSPFLRCGRPRRAGQPELNAHIAHLSQQDGLGLQATPLLGGWGTAARRWSATWTQRAVPSAARARRTAPFTSWRWRVMAATSAWSGRSSAESEMYVAARIGLIRDWSTRLVLWALSSQVNLLLFADVYHGIAQIRCFFLSFVRVWSI
jgi:hypothetical protein